MGGRVEGAQGVFPCELCGVIGVITLYLGGLGAKMQNSGIESGVFFLLWCANIYIPIYPNTQLMGFVVFYLNTRILCMDVLLLSIFVL